MLSHSVAVLWLEEAHLLFPIVRSRHGYTNSKKHLELGLGHSSYQQTHKKDWPSFSWRFFACWNIDIQLEAILVPKRRYRDL